ncbi:RNA-binding domain-containing protein [Streptomyces halstedii]|uniref:RNA-binding domain-containing protein n=1 Tax=Streptomyces halstedii TaxID=1944 RepID=UPI003D9E98B3
MTQTGFPKDVAAMANGSGGLIVYGVEESQKAATGRVDIGEFDETYERCAAPQSPPSPRPCSA